MRVHPFLAVAALLLVGVTALAAAAVVQHRQARARRPPPPEVEDFEPAPRHIFFTATPQAVRPVPAPAPEPSRGELHLHATGPHGLPVTDFEVYVHRRGDDPDDWTLVESPETDDEEAPSGTFAAGNLDPGRYDVRVESEGMRNVHLDDVPTSPKVLEISFARRPALLGAVGNLGGRGCAGITVAWSGPGDDAETGEETLDDDCSFFVEALPEEGPVTVVAKRGKLETRALVTPPLSGDAGLPVPGAARAGRSRRRCSSTSPTPTTRRSTMRASTWTLQATGSKARWARRRGRASCGCTAGARGRRSRCAPTATVTSPRRRPSLGAGVTEVLLTLPAATPEPAHRRGRLGRREPKSTTASSCAIVSSSCTEQLVGFGVALSEAHDTFLPRAPVDARLRRARVREFSDSGRL